MHQSGYTVVKFQIPKPPFLLTGNEPYSSINKIDGLTLVSAYFDVGTFITGEVVTSTRSKNNYFIWLKSFRNVNNSMILYTDVPKFGHLLKSYRSKFPEYMTQVFIIKQKELWAFKIKPDIESIFRQDGYPVNYPETLYSGYSSAMHAKYEIMEKVIKSNMVKTKHIAWIDFGYFRGKLNGLSTLELPKDLKDDHIAFGQKYRYSTKASARDIVHRAMVFVACSLFIGRPEYLLYFVQDYKQAVKDMIALRLMASDEQVLYYMYSHQTSAKVRVPVQTYSSFNRMSWHNIGQMMMRKDQERFRKNTTLLKQMLYTYIG